MNMFPPNLTSHRDHLVRTIAEECGWTDACDIAAKQYVIYLRARGITNSDIIKELCSVGLSRSGAASTIRDLKGDSDSVKADTGGAKSFVHDTKGKGSLLGSFAGVLLVVFIVSVIAVLNTQPSHEQELEQLQLFQREF